MATIVMTTRGTLGDHFPFLMLGRELKRRGHRVRLGINSAMHAYAEKFGLDCFTCGPVMGIEEAQKGAACWNHWTPPSIQDYKNRDRSSGESYRELFQVCKEADVLICSSIFFIGAMVQMVIDVPRITVCLSPMQVCSPLKNPDFITSNDESGKKSQEIYRESIKLFYQKLEEIRQCLNLPEITLSPEEWVEIMISNHSILAISPSFARPTDRYDAVETSGFIFYESPQWNEWRPEKKLEAFVEQELPPLVLSFSSLPLQYPQGVLEVHVRAAQKLGRKLIIQKGWAGFKNDHIPADVDKDMVLLTEFIPHDWLFSRAAAVIHHGGTGTTGRALRNGCPMLVEPYGNDQFFNAKRVLELEAGAAMHPFNLTADGLARVLEGKVLTSRYKQNVEDLSDKIREENGIKVACDFIERVV